MTNIKNYNSCNTLSSYELGDVCSFYLRNSNMPNLVKLKSTDSKREDIKQYKKALRTAIKENRSFKMSNGQYDEDFTRAVGVVIEKYEAVSPTALDTITVLFRTSNPKKRFVLDKYAVGTQYFSHTWTKEVVPAAVINLTAA